MPSKCRVGGRGMHVYGTAWCWGLVGMVGHNAVWGALGRGGWGSSSSSSRGGGVVWLEREWWCA